MHGKLYFECAAAAEIEPVLGGDADPGGERGFDTRAGQHLVEESVTAGRVDDDLEVTRLALEQERAVRARAIPGETRTDRERETLQLEAARARLPEQDERRRRCRGLRDDFREHVALEAAAGCRRDHADFAARQECEADVGREFERHLEFGARVRADRDGLDAGRNFVLDLQQQAVRRHIGFGAGVDEHQIEARHRSRVVEEHRHAGAREDALDAREELRSVKRVVAPVVLRADLRAGLAEPGADLIEAVVDDRERRIRGIDGIFVVVLALEQADQLEHVVDLRRAVQIHEDQIVEDALRDLVGGQADEPAHRAAQRRDRVDHLDDALDRLDALGGERAVILRFDRGDDRRRDLDEIAGVSRQRGKRRRDAGHLRFGEREAHLREERARPRGSR